MWHVARGLSLAKFASRLGATAAVTADDLSANMLSVTRSTAAREGLTIEWREGNAEQLPFRDAAFDLVLCQFALMFVTDKAAALSEMRRVVTQSGRVLISVWQGLDRHPFYQPCTTSFNNAWECQFSRRFSHSAMQMIGVGW